MQAIMASKLNGRPVQIMMRSLHLVWDSGPKWVIANVVLMFVQGLLPLLGLYLMKLIIDAVAKGIIQPDKEAAFGRALVLIAIAAGVAQAGVLCESLAGYVK